ncbi:hypothetical protein O0L34_g8588 [Tuta absoluta]|nr:hypothetical protein O0L34_g8588 [Tuta absoluta]
MNKIKGTKSKTKTTTSTCKKCRKSTEQKLIKCSICQTSYHFDCVGRSEKLHRLRSSTNYKCESCLHPSANTNSTLKPTNSTKKLFLIPLKTTVTPVAAPVDSAPSSKNSQIPLVDKTEVIMPAPSQIDSHEVFSSTATPLKTNTPDEKERECSSEEKSESNVSDASKEMESSQEEKTKINVLTSNSFSTLPVDD